MLLFNEGTYQHEDGFIITVDSEGAVMLSLDHPISIRLANVFDIKKWTALDDTTSDEDDTTSDEDDTETDGE